MESNKLLDYFKGDDLAAGVWQGKYAQEGEETPDDMHKRMAKEFAEVEEKYQKKEINFPEEGLSKYGYERTSLGKTSIYELFKDFKYLIPQGSIMSQLGAKSIGSLSNCFVIGQPEDSYGGIFEKDEELVQLMKRRGGVGIDISTLRPAGTPTTNTAKTTTGAVSFMHRFSNSTREVAQNGRRGALMISIDINHPDVMEFIKIKRDLTQVTGANISIKLNDEFMKAVENDEDYILMFPCNLQHPAPEYVKNNDKVEYDVLYPIEMSPSVEEKNPNISQISYFKKIKAKEYWDEIIKSAHNVAEPGLMFWDAMVDYSPDGVYPQFRQITTNPCSEIGMQPYDACRLIAHNLYHYVENPYTDQARFDMELFYKHNYEAMRLSDDLIDLEVAHINRIREKIDKDPEPNEIKRRESKLWQKVLVTALQSRRTGLGFTALGDTLAALGLSYDSDEALSFIDNLMKVKMESELDCTIDLAILRGPFEGWDVKKEYVHSIEGQVMEGNNEFYQFIDETFPEQSDRMIKYGRRNVSFSTVAPTGSVSLLAQTTSGIEPLFMPFYMRRKKVNPGEEGVRVDFTDQNGDTWQEFPVLHPRFKEWINYTYGANIIKEDGSGMGKEELEEWFEKSPWYGSTANDINWVRRVEIQGVIQKYITHSISSTINLPNDVKEEEVSEIYLESWKKGLKGITVYRDGSRSGVLVSTDTKDNNGSFDYKDAHKRPKELQCKVHNVVSAGNKYNIFIGLIDNKPYEVFVTDHFTDKKDLVIKKVKKGRYDLLENNEVYSEDITTEMSPEQEAITRLVSTSLRHGTDIKYIVEQLGKTSGDMFSFVKGLARVLKKYIPDGAKSTVLCNDCDSDNVIFEEGCHKCLDCGSSKCG